MGIRQNTHWRTLTQEVGPATGASTGEPVRNLGSATNRKPQKTAVASLL
jgi:hypothetical protein